MIHSSFLAVLKIPCVRHEIKAHSGVREDRQSDHFSGPYKQDGGRTLSIIFSCHKQHIINGHCLY